MGVAPRCGYLHACVLGYWGAGVLRRESTRQEAGSRRQGCIGAIWLAGYRVVVHGIFESETVCVGREEDGLTAIVVIAVSRHLDTTHQYTIHPLSGFGLAFFPLLLIHLVLPTTSQFTYTLIPWVFGYYRVVSIHLEPLDKPIRSNALTRCHPHPPSSGFNRFSSPSPPNSNAGSSMSNLEDARGRKPIVRDGRSSCLLNIKIPALFS